MNKKILVILFMFLGLSACGFKIVNKAEMINFNITDVVSTGENKINYRIKNKLLSYSKNDKPNRLLINLHTSKEKIVKEKNIRNEITKYSLKIKVDVEIVNLNKNDKNKFSLSKIGEYSVDSQYSQTLTNENRLIELYSDLLSNEILDTIIKKVK